MKKVGLDKYKLTKPPADPGYIDPWEITFHDAGMKPQTYRIPHSAGKPNVSRALLGAFYQCYGKVKPKSRRSSWDRTTKFVEFLTEASLQDNPDILDAGLLGQYLSWLKTKGLASTTIYKHFGTAETLSAKVAKARGRTLPRRKSPVPGIGRAGKPREHLSPIALIRILAAAKREVRETWETFCGAPNVDKDSRLGRTLQYIRDNMGGVVPPGGCQGQLGTMIQQSGGLEFVQRHLYATIESIAPFIILIAYETAANADAVRGFNRDCISADVLFAERDVLVWDKGRASRQQRVSRDRRGFFSAPSLIEKAQRLTEPLVPHVEPAHNNTKLFLARTPKKYSRIAPVSAAAMIIALRAFIARNAICEEDGTPVRFSLGMMRPSVLAEVYRRTGDLLVTSRLANHASFGTTIRYVIDRVTNDLHDTAIASVQAKLQRVLADSLNPKTTAEAPADTSAINARGADRDCKNPYSRPNGGPGELCPTWLWPLNDPGLVVLNDTRYVVHLVRQLRMLEEMRRGMLPGRFEKLYAAGYAIIRDKILPELDVAIVAEANRLADSMPALPVFENE